MTQGLKQKYWFWKNIVTSNRCLEIHNFIEKNFDEYEKPHLIAKDSNKTSTVKIIYWNKMKNVISDLIAQCVRRNDTEFGYNIYPQSDLQGLHYNIYSSNNLGGYDWHTDGTNHYTYDIKLTVLINLSTEKYEGGEFQLNTGSPKTVDEFSEPGGMIMFPSYYLHRVTPVTKGERRTLAMFFEGPRFT